MKSSHHNKQKSMLNAYHTFVGGEVTDFSMYTMKWLEQVTDCGGLLHVSDETPFVMKVWKLATIHCYSFSCMPFSKFQFFL